MRISDIFCSSPASTTVRPLHHERDVTGCRISLEIHRQMRNPNTNKDKTFPCFSSEMPFVPISRQINCRNSFDTASGLRRKITSVQGGEIPRKSSVDVSDELRTSRSSLLSSSSKYLLKDHKSCNKDDKDLRLSSSDRFKELIPFGNHNVTTSSSSSSSSSVTSVLSPAPATEDQVVVLRVSIHCKGCEGKVRKHISKMEGVTSYKIDLGTKMVTVVGKITPLEVVKSISKVKFAQLWPLSSSPSFPQISNHSLLKS